MIALTAVLLAASVAGVVAELFAAGPGIHRVVLAASLGGLVAALLLRGVLARRLVGELRQLAETAGRLGDGQDTARVPMRYRGELAGLAVAFNDMAERLAAQRAALTALATTDPLTGLYNRRAFQAHLAHEVDRADRLGGRLAVLMLDLDHFKSINDRYGHPGGDAVLRTVAATLTRELRPTDVTSRFGGEEFAVLLRDCDERDVLKVAERLRSAVAACSIPELDSHATVTTSVGVVCYPDHADTGDGVLQAADRALYTAKHTGRDRVCDFTAPSTNTAHEQDLKPTPRSGDVEPGRRRVSCAVVGRYRAARRPSPGRRRRAWRSTSRYAGLASLGHERVQAGDGLAEMSRGKTPQLVPVVPMSQAPGAASAGSRLHGCG